jgi:hypothetical protein
LVKRKGVWFLTTEGENALSNGETALYIAARDALGGFTPDAKSTARSSNIHVELIDLNRFLNLWQDFYPKFNDEDKSLMPLLPVYFLAPDN